MHLVVQRTINLNMTEPRDINRTLADFAAMDQINPLRAILKYIEVHVAKCYLYTEQEPYASIQVYA